MVVVKEDAGSACTHAFCKAVLMISVPWVLQVFARALLMQLNTRRVLWFRTILLRYVVGLLRRHSLIFPRRVRTDVTRLELAVQGGAVMRQEKAIRSCKAQRDAMVGDQELEQETAAGTRRSGEHRIPCGTKHGRDTYSDTYSCLSNCTEPALSTSLRGGCCTPLARHVFKHKETRLLRGASWSETTDLWSVHYVTKTW